MEMEIELKLSGTNEGLFFIEQDEKLLAQLQFNIVGNELHALHTEVDKTLEGRGIASGLFEELIFYARQNGYTIVPVCPYIATRLKRNPSAYADVWESDDF